MASTPTPDDTRVRVRGALEDELARVTTPEQAEEVLRRAEQLAGGATESQRGDEAAMAAGAAVQDVEQATATPGRTGEAAAVLSATAAQAVAPTGEAEAVLQGAQEAVGTAARPDAAAPPPAAQRGRDLLRRAVFKRMGPVQALDARLFLWVNDLPHGAWADRLLVPITLVTTGGWVWTLVGLMFARRSPRMRQRVVREVLPSIAMATWLVEHPMKAYFRRTRPFIEIVQALVVGKKPGSWSFPSGHTAGAFAGALMLAPLWPSRAPWFFGLAGAIGFSRVYVGAHYPGDVLSGASLGMIYSGLVRLGLRRLLS